MQANNESWVNEYPVSSSLPSFGASKHSMWGLCTSYVSITGYVLLGLIVLGYIIASKRILLLFKIPIFVPRSCFGRLGTFDAFYWSHTVMAASFVIILLLHPLPGLPNLSTSTGSITWVRTTIYLDIDISNALSSCFPYIFKPYALG